MKVRSKIAGIHAAHAAHFCGQNAGKLALLRKTAAQSYVHFVADPGTGMISQLQLEGDAPPPFDNFASVLWGEDGVGCAHAHAHAQRESRCLPGPAPSSGLPLRCR